MINQESATDLKQQEITDAKRLKRFKILTPVKGILEGSSTTFEGSYLNFFLTDVYRLPIIFTGILSAVTLILTWVFAPLFAAFSDKFKFKKSKFWPWPIIGGTVTHIGYVAVMSLPAIFGGRVSSLGSLAFALILLIRMSAQISGVPVSGMAPLIAKTPADRQFLAQGTKIGHEAGKAIWGYLVPLVLLATTNFFGGDQNKGYVLTAAILHSIGWTGLATYALFAIKGSYVEREALKQTEQLQRKRIPMSQTLKVLFTNRPVLGIFLFFALHKAYFFIYVVYGVHVYKYIFNQPEAVGIFMAIISIAAMAGVFCGRMWTKIFKESKRSCAMAMSIHIIATLVIALTFNKVSIPMFLIFFAISSFFMGMLETWVTPLYTACAEYGSWKTGVTMNALIMSTNGLTISSGSALPPVIASIVIGSAALGTAEYVRGLTTLFTWVPLFLAIASLLCFVFIYNLNDSKIALIQADLAAGKTQATSDLKL